MRLESAFPRISVAAGGVCITQLVSMFPGISVAIGGGCTMGMRICVPWNFHGHRWWLYHVSEGLPSLEFLWPQMVTVPCD